MQLSNLTTGGWLFFWLVLAITIDVAQDLAVLPALRVPIYRKQFNEGSSWSPLLLSALIVRLLWLMTP
jgi:hypothetical protein